VTKTQTNPEQVDRPVRRRLQRDEIKDRIVERILDGAYGLGERIVESQVAAEFGTGQELGQIHPHAWPR
jgi:DNA-binding GntR family transcriptional regulator